MSIQHRAYSAGINRRQDGDIKTAKGRQRINKLCAQLRDFAFAENGTICAGNSRMRAPDNSGSVLKHRTAAPLRTTAISAGVFFAAFSPCRDRPNKWVALNTELV
jgi:hypothetical protein